MVKYKTTLKQWIQSTFPKPTHIVYQLIRGIASGINSIHESGIAHLNINTTTILIDIESDGFLYTKLSDFGYAHVLETPALRQFEGKSNKAVPHSYFPSPELINQNIQDNKIVMKIDLFAFSGVLYELIVKKLWSV